MKVFRFIDKPGLPEALMRDPVLLEIARTMTPDDIIQALINDLGFKPEAAAQTCGALMRHANNAMSMPYRAAKDSSTGNLDTDLAKLARQRSQDQDGPERGQMEDFGLTPSTAIPTYMFPAEEEEDEEWPYDAGTKGIMNSPLSGGPRMTT